MAIGAQGDALFNLPIDGGPAVVGSHAVDRLLGAVAHDVVKVDYGRVAGPAVVTELLGFELDPFLTGKAFISGYTGLDGFFVGLVVGLLVEAVLGPFFGFVFVWHDFVPPRTTGQGVLCLYGRSLDQGPRVRVNP